MLVAEIQELEEVKTLVTRGQQLGVLTFGDVATAVSEVELDESDVEDLYGQASSWSRTSTRPRRPPPRTSAPTASAVASARRRST
jgi:Sigma-70 factor, region 1.1